jgi:hypothetical protein
MSYNLYNTYKGYQRVGFHLRGRNFSEVLAKIERWVSQFLQRHNVGLTVKYTNGIDRSRFNAD